MRRVLITSAGSATGHGFLVSLRRAWGRSVFLLAADTNPANLVAASVSADAFETISTGDSNSYVDQVLSLVTRFGIDTVVPVHDGEIERIQACSGQISEVGARILSPDVETVRICNDKLETARILGAAGLHSPKTGYAKVGIPVPAEGLFLKPRFGVGSVGARLVRTSAELEAALSDGRTLVAQEPCREPEVTIDAFVSRNTDTLVAWCRERLAVKSGVCVKARVFSNREGLALTRQVGAALGLTGAFCLQTMHRADGTICITDINPRPGGGTAMSLAVGANFPAAAVADLWGLPVKVFFPVIDRDYFVVRQYSEFVTQ